MRKACMVPFPWTNYPTCKEKKGLLEGKDCSLYNEAKRKIAQFYVELAHQYNT